MNKTELIRTLAEKTSLTQKDITKVIDILPELIKETVVSGDKISLTGFITFEKVDIPERSGTVQLGTNKGSAWTTPAHSEIKAKISKNYKLI